MKADVKWWVQVLFLMAVFGLFTGAGKAAATDLWFEPDRCYQIMTTRNGDVYQVKVECP